MENCEGTHRTETIRLDGRTRHISNELTSKTVRGKATAPPSTLGHVTVTHTTLFGERIFSSTIHTRGSSDVRVDCLDNVGPHWPWQRQRRGAALVQYEQKIKAGHTQCRIWYRSCGIEVRSTNQNRPLRKFSQTTHRPSRSTSK